MWCGHLVEQLRHSVGHGPHATAESWLSSDSSLLLVHSLGGTAASGCPQGDGMSSQILPCPHSLGIWRSEAGGGQISPFLAFSLCLQGSAFQISHFCAQSVLCAS